MNDDSLQTGSQGYHSLPKSDSYFEPGDHVGLDSVGCTQALYSGSSQGISVPKLDLNDFVDFNLYPQYEPNPAT